MNKKKGILLTVIGLIGIIVITVGVTYAFFNYVKEGTTDNTITTSTITFLYTEIDKVGAGISIKDAYPISDSQGKMLSGTNEVFDFKITSTTPNTSSIPYEITARKNSESTLDEKAVKLYLTKVVGNSEEEVLLSKYSDLGQTSKISKDKYTEKTIYTGKVPADSKNYEQAFKLRMWISSDTNFSPDENDNYPYNNKEFSITVNVYANAKVVTEEEVLDASKAEISSLSINGEEVTPVTDQDYHYEISLPEGTTSTTLDIETEGEYSTVKVERIDSLVLETTNIRRLSTKKTVDLNPGDNYFKVTVTSEDGKTIKEYKIKIKVIVMYIRYNIGDSVTAVDGSKWHVLEFSDETKSDVVLLSDYNLNSDGTYNTECGISINDTYICSPMAFDSNNTKNYDISDKNNIGYFVDSVYKPLVNNSLFGTVNVTVPTAAQIAIADSKNFNQNNLTLTSSWLLTTNYWTKTGNNAFTYSVWRVASTATTIGLSGISANDYERTGVRPVITTPKTNLLVE